MAVKTSKVSTAVRIQPARELLAEAIITTIIANAARVLRDRTAEREGTAQDLAAHVGQAVHGIEVALKSDAPWLPERFKKKRSGVPEAKLSIDAVRLAIDAFVAPRQKGRPRKGAPSRAGALSNLLKTCGIGMTPTAVRQRLTAGSALRPLLEVFEALHSSHFR
ncbi:MAG: hypothetical protein ABI335_01755 [Polyangiaceae bacterium]